MELKYVYVAIKEIPWEGAQAESIRVFTDEREAERVANAMNPDGRVITAELEEQNHGK
jgi:hypothetical protein